MDRLADNNLEAIRAELNECLRTRSVSEGYAMAELYIPLMAREIIRLRNEIERLQGDDFIPHESGDECISCERPASEGAAPYCALCLMRYQYDCANVEVERLKFAWKVQASTIEFLQGEIVKWHEMAENCRRELEQVRALATS